jgi:tetratricopeptide (TPR) repeat protein
MLREGDRLAGRFEVRGSASTVVTNNRILWKRLFLGRESPKTVREEELWLHAIDRQTGADVWIAPRGEAYGWEHDLRREAIARHVMAMRLPSTVTVLHVGPGVVFAEPPPAEPRPTLPLAAAATCTLEACEVVARLHAVGCAGSAGGLFFGPRNLRVVEVDMSWHIAWLVPGLDALNLLDTAEAQERGASDKPRDEDPIALDLMRLTELFFSLHPAALAPDPRPRQRDAERAAARSALARLHRGEEDAPPIGDVASLAQLFLPLVEPKSAWAQRIAALPVVRSLPRLSLDWDGIIAEGEAELAKGTDGSTRDHDNNPFIALPLAAAYHQRASRSFARGDLRAALTDAERAIALDAFLPYHTTRAVLLDALGRRAEARREIDGALAVAPPPSDDEHRRWIETLPPSKEDHARARVTRGMIAYREGALAEAAEDLRRALDLYPTAFAAHALGAALYARGDAQGAAEAEALSVELEPENLRYRWALVLSLRKLGREGEARTHGEQILQMAPGAPVHQQRFAQIFDPPHVYSSPH